MYGNNKFGKQNAFVTTPVPWFTPQGFAEKMIV